jgi:hypothetical protein
MRRLGHASPAAANRYLHTVDGRDAHGAGTGTVRRESAVFWGTSPQGSADPLQAEVSRGHWRIACAAGHAAQWHRSVRFPSRQWKLRSGRRV